MSAPSLDISDTKAGAFRVPVVSSKTAFLCLDRVCGSIAMRAQTKAIEDIDDVQEGVLPIDRLIAIAGKSGVQLQTAHFDWRTLLIAIATKTVMLLLRNHNVITVLGTGRDGIEEVVASDPLYQNGEPFFLPRLALEHAWEGDALVIKPKRGKTERALAWYLSILSVCGIAAAMVLLFQGGIGATITGSHAARENSAAIAPKDAAVPAASDQASQIAAAGASDATSQASANPASGSADAGEPAEANLASPAMPNAEPAAASPDAAMQQAEPLAPAAGDRGLKPEAALEPAAKPAAPADEQTAVLPTPAPAPALTPPATANLSPEEIAALIARGDALIIKGDVASARLFYERAADAADGQAALRLGESYDPAFLARAHVTGARGDLQTAARWYRRARELGASEADALLRTLSP